MTSSKIEWTDATWNPVTGCSKVSPGCDNCYMFTLYPRLRAMAVRAMTWLQTGYDNARTFIYAFVLEKAASGLC